MSSCARGRGWARLGEPEPEPEPELELDDQDEEGAQHQHQLKHQRGRGQGRGDGEEEEEEEEEQEGSISVSVSIAPDEIEAQSEQEEQEEQEQEQDDDEDSGEDILEAESPRANNQVIVALAATADDSDLERAAEASPPPHHHHHHHAHSRARSKPNSKPKPKSAPHPALGLLSVPPIEPRSLSDADDDYEDEKHDARDIEMDERPVNDRDENENEDDVESTKPHAVSAAVAVASSVDGNASALASASTSVAASTPRVQPKIESRASSAIKLTHPANVRVRTLFGAVWLKPRRKCMWEINDEVRFTVWLLALVSAIIAVGFFIASLATQQITFSEVLEIHKHAVGIIVGGIFSTLATIMSAVQIRQHWNNWTHPPSQRCVVRILFMVPVYAISAWLSLVFIKSSLYIDFIRLCYEAFVLYTFLILLTKYLGGHEGVVECMRTKPPIDWPTPFCICDPVQPSSRFLYWIKYCTLQYTIITPILSLLAIVLSLFGAYGDGEVNFEKGFIYVALVQNFSQLVSLYCLVWLYVVLKNELRPFKPMSKFLVVKSVVFFTFWQGILLALLVNYNYIQDYQEYSAGEIQIGLQDLCVCIEMFIAAAVHKYTFGYETYANGEMKLLMDQRAFYLAQQSYQRAVAQQHRAAEAKKARQLAHQLQIALDHRRLGGADGTVLTINMDEQPIPVNSPRHDIDSRSGSISISAVADPDPDPDIDVERGLITNDSSQPIEIDEELIEQENNQRVAVAAAKLEHLRVDVAEGARARLSGIVPSSRPRPRPLSTAADDDEGSALFDETELTSLPPAAPPVQKSPKRTTYIYSPSSANATGSGSPVVSLIRSHVQLHAVDLYAPNSSSGGGDGHGPPSPMRASGRVRGSGTSHVTNPDNKSNPSRTTALSSVASASASPSASAPRTRDHAHTRVH